MSLQLWFRLVRSGTSPWKAFRAARAVSRVRRAVAGRLSYRETLRLWWRLVQHGVSWRSAWGIATGKNIPWRPLLRPLVPPGPTWSKDMREVVKGDPCYKQRPPRPGEKD